MRHCQHAAHVDGNMKPEGPPPLAGHCCFPKAQVGVAVPPRPRVQNASHLEGSKLKCRGELQDELLYAEHTWGRGLHATVTMNSKLLQNAKRQKNLKVTWPKPLGSYTML